MCTYTLKEFIDYYKCRGTTVYVTFLDASKAFDRLNYWLLFDKLIKKHVPLFIIKLLLLTPERPGIEILIKNIFGDLFVTIYI